AAQYRCRRPLTPHMSWIEVTYRVRAARDELEAVARGLALEQSVELAPEVVTDAFGAERNMGRVGAIYSSCAARCGIGISLATETTGFDVAQTLNMLFGNSSLHAHIELVDVAFPPDFLARFSGPRYGIEGIRRQLDIARRPLTCVALKPQGLKSDALAQLCY